MRQLTTKITNSNINLKNEKLPFNKVKYQFLAACCANIIVLAQGCAMGWLSPSIPILQSENSPLHNGAITRSEASWIGSLSSIGAAVGTIYFGLISDCLGSKNTMVLCTFPILAFWLCVLFGIEAWHLCLGRFITGLAGGAFICIQLFLADIASEQVRGRLGCLQTLYINIGILIGYIGGTYLDYYTVPLIMMVFPIIFICLFITMPNTPQYFLRKEKIERAEKSLRFYRGCRSVADKENLEFIVEFDKLKAIAKQNELGEKLQLSDFFNPITMKAMLIGPILMAVNQFSGTQALVSYASTIFKESGSNFDPNISAIVLGSIQIIGTYFASILIDRIGRRILLILSTIGTAIGLSVMGVFSLLNYLQYDLTMFKLVPVISLSFVIFIASIGIIPVPYVLIAEVLPSKVRNIGATLCTTTVSIYGFIMLKSFPYLLDGLQLYGCMFLFSSVSIFGLLFTIFAVPETKGKNLDVLENLS